MPKITIDHRQVEVPMGATVLAAARKLGIDVPTLCHLDGYEPSTSCLVCMVKILGEDKLVPSCGALAVGGMRVESETDEVHKVRQSALELLLSDHLGDCLAPCQLACPAQMDIPLMLRQISAGDLRAAMVTVKRDIALPAALGRICPAPCEKVCRRRPADGAVAICRLKRFVADADLAGAAPYLPTCKPASGKRVAIIGAGPAGLAAAYELAQQGHACTILDENDKPGGRLRHEPSEDELPRTVLDAEIETVLALGIDVRANTRVSGETALRALRRDFDAVLFAAGATARDQAEAWDLRVASRGIEVQRGTYRTKLEGVFAAGGAIRGRVMVIRSLADGKEAAASIDQYLSGRPVTGPPIAFTTKIGRLGPEELSLLLVGAPQQPRRDPAGDPHAGYSGQEAAEQAARCLHCDCRKLTTCRLREHAIQYGADPRLYGAEHRRFQLDTQHAEVIYEPGKCIDCGLCIQIAAAGGEPLGLTFIGRGFDVRVGVPLGGALDEALQKVAAECVAACPTAALAFKLQSE